MNITELRAEAVRLQEKLNSEGLSKQERKQIGRDIFLNCQALAKAKTELSQEHQEAVCLHVIQHETGRVSSVLGPTSCAEMQFILFQDATGWFQLRAFGPLTDEQMEEVPLKYHDLETATAFTL